MIAVPLIVGLASLFVASWLWVLGVSGGHGLVFGWLSTERHTAKGQPIWGPSRVIPAYFLSVVLTYICYQLIEVIAGAFRLFKEALA